MTIRLYGAVKDQGLVAEADLGRRLGELALCCRGLEIAIDSPGRWRPTCANP